MAAHLWIRELPEKTYLPPMSKFEFCLPTNGKAVPAGPEWFHEIKYGLPPKLPGLGDFGIAAGLSARLNLRSMPTLSSTRTGSRRDAAETAALEASKGRGARDAASDRR
jgi:hypothetical protein